MTLAAVLASSARLMPYLLTEAAALLPIAMEDGLHFFVLGMRICRTIRVMMTKFLIYFSFLQYTYQGQVRNV